MSDVMFIGPYRQGDGWGGGARDYVQCLNQTSHNIVTRPVYMSNRITNDIPEDILKLENKFLDKKPDYVIQNVLPHLLQWQHGSKNIGLFYLENSNIKATGWVSHINLMDEVWVNSSFEQEVLLDSGVTIPTRLVPMPYDFSKAEKEYKLTPIPEINNSFTFYFIGEYIDRKNIGALVKAFHMEFTHSDNVSLVIKTNAAGVTPEELTQKVLADVNNIKSGMRKYLNVNMYIPEFIVTEMMSEDDLFSLHKSADCFVMPSKGESLNRPLMDAVAMGNQVIYTRGVGMRDVAPCGFDVVAHKSPTLTSNPPMRNLYTSHESWQEIDIYALAEAMRTAYMTRNHEIAEQSIDRNQKHLRRHFSQEAISKKIEEALC